MSKPAWKSMWRRLDDGEIFMPTSQPHHEKYTLKLIFKNNSSFSKLNPRTLSKHRFHCNKGGGLESRILSFFDLDYISVPKSPSFFIKKCMILDFFRSYEMLNLRHANLFAFSNTVLPVRDSSYPLKNKMGCYWILFSLRQYQWTTTIINSMIYVIRGQKSLLFFSIFASVVPLYSLTLLTEIAEKNRLTNKGRWNFVFKVYFLTFQRNNIQTQKTTWD
jgi:hypothetical protein